MNVLVVGRLIGKAQVFNVRIAATQVINHYSKAFVMRVEGPDPNWRQPASTDLSSFGRHYLLRSYNNSKVHRHYTVAACMKREAYDQYVGLVKQFRENNELPSRFYTFEEGVLPEKQEEVEIVFVCKNYKIESGLSHRLHNNCQDLC